MTQHDLDREYGTIQKFSSIQLREFNKEINLNDEIEVISENEGKEEIFIGKVCQIEKDKIFIIDKPSDMKICIEIKEIDDIIILKEEMTTSDVETYMKPVGSEVVTYRNRPCFMLDKTDFRKLVKNQIIPEPVKTFSKSNGTRNLYMKSIESGVVFNLEKFMELHSIDF